MNQPINTICDSDPSSLTIEEARSAIFNALSPLSESESISSENALGRIVQQSVVSPIDIPSFRASAMDGYAIRSSESHDILTITGASLAGHPGSDSLETRTCQRITTGARIPDDADCVVQQENVTVNGNSLTVNTHPTPGTHVREPGTDSQKNNILMSAGKRIGAAEVALLAAHGIADLNVVQRLKIAVFSTGDELVEPGRHRSPGQIYDANRSLLKALLTDPTTDVSDLGICPDTADDLSMFINEASEHDLIVSSGGVSVGDADYVKEVLERIGKVNLWKIAMKPGRPLTFGFAKHQTPYFGLPGNPVSAALTCLLFVKPAINHLLGMQYLALPPMMLPLEGKLTKNPGRVEYQRAIVKKTSIGEWIVSTTGIQDSHVLTSLHKANCLIELPIDSAGADTGDLVSVFPFTHFASNLT